MRHDDYPFPEHFFVFYCSAKSKRAIGSLLAFLRIVVLGLFAFIIIILARNILRGMREFLFHELMLALDSYHRETIIRTDLLSLCKLVERGCI